MNPHVSHPGGLFRALAEREYEEDSSLDYKGIIKAVQARVACTIKGIAEFKHIAKELTGANAPAPAPAPAPRPASCSS